MIVTMFVHGFERKINAPIPKEESLALYIDQVGVEPGERKFEQFQNALRLRGAPPLYAQENIEEVDVLAYVKLFDPCGSWTWFLTEWDGDETAFGLVFGHETEWGYVSLRELAEVKGRMRIGIEIDTYTFHPKTIAEVRKEMASWRN
jgi:hypothetical protein